MAPPLTLKDHLREAALFRSRALAAAVLVSVLAAILLARIAYLQIWQYEKYSTISDENRITTEPIGPNRGLIYDRNGAIVADNQPSFTLSIIKEQTSDLDYTVRFLADLIELAPDDVDRFYKRMRQRQRPYASVPLRFQLTEEEIAKIAVNQHLLPGVQVDANLIRHYPYRDLLSHAIGYVSRINEQELKQLDPAVYAATQFIGKLGVEKAYESQLHGSAGYQQIEINARGRVMRVMERSDPVSGSDLELYLDLPTQRAATDALVGRKGAVVAIDPNTGGVLAFVSAPGFDPNLFVKGIDQKTYSELNRGRERPLYNRASRGTYPPGSTIKPIMGLAGLDTGFTNWGATVFDPGWFRLEGQEHFYRDWKKWGHGTVNLEKAIIESCDTYFYSLANRMGIDRMHDFFSPFGFGRKTGIDLDSEAAGILPSRFWKRASRGVPWFPGETLIAGIGQGYFTATPLQLATATAIIAVKGKPVVPRMVAKVDGEPVPLPTDMQPIILHDQSNWDKMQYAMMQVVHGPSGTAKGINKNLPYHAAGKTGTAQVVGIAQGEKYDASRLADWNKDHALFVGFAPVEHPLIAVAIMVENGGGGGATAAPVARQVFDAYFASLAHTQPELVPWMKPQ